MVAAVLVQLERHDRHPGAGKGALSYATQLLSTSRPIRAPRSVVAAEVHAADEGDTTTITSTLDAAQRNLTNVGAQPSSDDPAECVADKGYHARAILKDLDGGPWKTRIAEPQRKGVLRWHGDKDARRAVYNNRVRLRS